jgi:hypothetical protein
MRRKGKQRREIRKVNGPTIKPIKSSNFPLVEMEINHDIDLFNPILRSNFLSICVVITIGFDDVASSLLCA